MSRKQFRVFDLLYLSFHLCHVIFSGITTGLDHVFVKEESDALLPCSLSTKENIEGKLFDWKKDGQKEVFMYDASIHYNNGRTGQDEQFKGRVSHFQDELKLGNASIIIRNTKGADSGNYTCDFPRLQSQKFLIELVVVGAATEPYITAHKAKDGVMLQCLVRGAFLKPTVEFKDSSGNVVPADEPQVSERGGGVILQATVTKTDTFSCVVTQEEINHQIYAETYVPLPPPCKNGFTTGSVVGAVLGTFFVIVAGVLAVFCVRRSKVKKFKEGSQTERVPL